MFEAPTIYKEIIDRGEPQGLFDSSDSRYVAPLGSIPKLNNSNTQIQYGIYPQTLLEDENGIYDTLNTLTPESNGYYIYNGDYYASVIAKPFVNTKTFDNGDSIVKDQKYWFKCAPITWKILSNNSGEYLLLSNVLLDAHLYYSSQDTRTIDGKTIYCNNYQYSEIREWLNTDFFNSSFVLTNTYVQTTYIDNSAETTSGTPNQYACDDTEDKVFLLSYQDYLNNDYGFVSNADRQCRPTDWAKARGSYANANQNYNGAYWTRSPDTTAANNAGRIEASGNLFKEYVVYSYNNVRPAITLVIE